MEPVGLTSLPVEVIQHISCYLSECDVLSCSLTCHYLRNALNDNVVWRKYLPYDLSRLGTQKQLLSPTINIDENLASLCENRQQFVRKTQVLNNWRQGHCVQYERTTELWYVNGVFNKTKGKGNVMYDDKYIFFGRFISDDKSDGIKVWDITNIPICHTFFKIDYVKYDCFFIVGNYLVVVECIQVFVYRINLPDKAFPLVYSFMISDKNVTLNKRVEHSNKHDISCIYWDHVIVNNYLISKHYRDMFFYIWDIHNASKVGLFQPAIECKSNKLHSLHGKMLLCELTLQFPSMKCWTVFDIEKLQFSDYKFSCPKNERYSKILLFESYIILFQSTYAFARRLYKVVCKIFDFNTSLKLKERYFNHKNNMLDSINIVNGRFGILCNDGFHIVDALTLETMYLCKIDNVKYILKQMVLFQSYVVIAACNNDELELWDINRRSKLPVDLKQFYIGDLYLDKLFTKLITINSTKINVLHFW